MLLEYCIITHTTGFSRTPWHEVYLKNQSFSLLFDHKNALLDRQLSLLEKYAFHNLGFSE